MEMDSFTAAILLLGLLTLGHTTPVPTEYPGPFTTVMNPVEDRRTTVMNPAEDKVPNKVPVASATDSNSGTVQCQNTVTSHSEKDGLTTTEKTTTTTEKTSSTVGGATITTVKTTTVVVRTTSDGTTSTTQTTTTTETTTTEKSTSTETTVNPVIELDIGVSGSGEFEMVLGEVVDDGRSSRHVQDTEPEQTDSSETDQSHSDSPHTTSLPQANDFITTTEKPSATVEHVTILEPTTTTEGPKELNTDIEVSGSGMPEVPLVDSAPDVHVPTAGPTGMFTTTIPM